MNIKKNDNVKTKPVPGGTIKTTAVINTITVGKHEDKISFTALHLSAKENVVKLSIALETTSVGNVFCA